MNVALIGYGKMGKEIEKILLEKGHNISVKINATTPIESIDFSTTDIAIEFSTPKSAFTNISFCLKHQIPVVVGTTGWYSKLEEVKALCEQNNGALLYATNFSIGVNIFFKVNQYLAQIMNHFTDYDCEVKEIHHTEKLDAPSGTGITIAEQIIKNLNRYQIWENTNKVTAINTLPLVSERLPEVPGTHIVKYENDIDKIELTHTAHQRKGFALGSVLAAEWLLNKKGIYKMTDVFDDIIKTN
jgi:4-hydroxy-tetrahydrodipicolinate reductase